MMKKSLLKRTKWLQGSCLVSVILMMLSLIRISAILPGISEAADQEKKTARAKAHEKEYIRGSILDRDGEQIVWSEEPLGKRNYLHPYAYSNVTGYWSRIYGTSGIEKLMNADLTYAAAPYDHKVGADVKLTLKSSIQEQAYEDIRAYEGSVVVLDAKTGEILALASSPGYDITKLEEDWEEINKSQGKLISNATQNPIAPGSVFKLVTSKAILDAGIESETVKDKGYLRVNGQKIRNYNGTEYGTVDFEKGFVKSSNVYFMDRALKLGQTKMRRAAEAFMLGKEIDLDFTTLRSEFSLEGGEDNLLASTAFGQGNTLITPLHMAMITQAAANGGLMCKPYLIQNVTNVKEEVLYEGKTENLGTVLNSNTAHKLKRVMTKAGESYGLDRVGNGEAKIAAKTGTAQRGDGTNNAWLVSFAPADDPKYVVVACRLKTKMIGKDLAPIVEDLYHTLLE